MKNCTHEGCKRPYLAKGLCRLHYDRQWSGRDLNAPLVLSKAMDFINSIPETDDCVLWPYCSDEHGYGKMRSDIFGGRSVGAYRVSLWMHKGPPPSAGLFSCHSCNNPPCVNPRHLYWGSRYENHIDAVVNGSASVGYKHPKAKLTADDVKFIRSSGEEAKVLADRYGVHVSTIYSSRSGKRYKNV